MEREEKMNGNQLRVQGLVWTLLFLERQRNVGTENKLNYVGFTKHSFQDLTGKTMQTKIISMTTMFMIS